MPVHASQMYARNVGALLSLLIVDGALKLDFSDEIISGTCLTHAGRRMDVPAPAAGAPSVPPPANPVGARA
jgi:NAD(P) transhydrogenase subunit alpha